MEALLVIDVQKAFNHEKFGKRNNPDAENNMVMIIDYFRNQNKEVIHIQHVSDNPISLFHKDNLQDFKNGFQPLMHEKVFRKTVNSAFIGTTLLEYLQSKSIKSLTIIGLTLPHCVSTTTRMAQNFGFNVTLISDATASFDLLDYHGRLQKAEDIHHCNLTALYDEFANVIDTQTLLGN